MNRNEVSRNESDVCRIDSATQLMILEPKYGIVVLCCELSMIFFDAPFPNAPTAAPNV